MGVFGHDGLLSKAWHKTEELAHNPVVQFAVGGFVGLQLGQSYAQNKANKENLKIQQQALAQQQAELERQKKREIEQQKRENEQLMNSVSNLTNTSYSGVSSPSVDYDKYGDLG